MPTDFSAEQDAQFESDLQRARGYKPVTQKEMRQGYSQYKKQGLKFGQVKKGMSDEALYKRAEHIVLAWWKQQQKDKIQEKKARRQRANDPLKGAQSAWAGGNYSGGGTGGYGSNSGGGSYLPDTAMGRDSGPTKKLPDIREHLNPRQVRAKLQELGVPDTWQVPSQFRRTPQSVERWAKQEAERRDMIIRANGKRAYYDNSVVAQVARQVGFPINVSSVPLRYRQTHAEIRAYILRQKRAWQLTVARRSTSTGIDAPTINRTSGSYLSKVRNIPV